MIRVGDLKKIIIDCSPDWTIRLSKWEHCTEDELKKRSHPMPNLTSVQINDTSNRYNDDGGKIYQYIFEESDEDFIKTRDEMLQFFCNGRNDNDLLDFVLEVELSKGHFDYIPLMVESGDKGYSDKSLTIDLIELGS